MMSHTIRLCLAALLVASSAPAQEPSTPAPLPPGQSDNPFPAPIAATEGVIRVNVREFASLPDIAGVAARMMNLVDEPDTRRLFVNDMRGPLYSVSYDGKTVQLYLDINDSSWGVGVQSNGRERGFQSFTFHPQFGQAGTPGFGFTDMPSGEIFYVSADRLPSGGQDVIRRILLNVDGNAKTGLEVIQARNRAQGKPPATRADLRINGGPGNQVFLLNKGDGMIRVLMP